MTTVRIRNPQASLSAALLAARQAVSGHVVTLRELLGQIGEQGLLVFCAMLAVPFMLPVTIPFMSTVLGLPMLLIALSVTANRVPWLPDRLLDRSIPAAALAHALDHAIATATRFEHLIRPRVLALSGSTAANVVNGLLLLVAVLLLMMPLPLVPFANTLPAIAIILLCLGMAERDGLLLGIGYAVCAAATAYVGGLLWLVFAAGRNADEAWRVVKELAQRLLGG
jgi:hypothetical protein